MLGGSNLRVGGERARDGRGLVVALVGLFSGGGQQRNPRTARPRRGRPLKEFQVLSLKFKVGGVRGDFGVF